MAYNIDEEKLETTAKEIDNEAKIPAGYIPIELSTKGKLGAPKLFHIRNFNTGELMDLALTDTEDLPLRVVNVLQDLVFEDDVKIADFHEKEVEETLFYLYQQFYGTILTNLAWPVSEEDKEKIAKDSGGKGTEEYVNRMQALNSGSWKPTFDINLKNVTTYEIPDSIKTTACVKKSNGFECSFSYPRYGDVLILKKFVDNYFKEKDKKWAKTKDVIRQKMDLKDKWEKGESVADPNRIYIPENEYKEYKEYEKEKVLFTVRATIALHLRSIRGENIEQLPLEKRIKYAEDPELDHSTFRDVSEAFSKLKVGLVEDIEAFDPILRKNVKIEYSFRVFTLLQAIRDNKSTETTITFE